MGALSDYSEAQVINHMLRNQAYTPPATVYLALYTTTPDDTGGGVEVSGGAYARQACALDAATVGVTANTSDITFPTATANWGTIVAVGLFDAVTAGNLLWWGALTVNKTVNNGDVFKVLLGDLDLTLD